MSNLYLRNMLIGILATLTMDILTGVSTKLRLIAPLSARLIGRWFAGVGRGQLLHSDIGQVAAIKQEMAIAVTVHYAIGLTLALIYLFVSASLGLASRNPITALGFALCTNIFPGLLMFPAMGYGWFGSHGPADTRLLPSSLITHCFSGVGLWPATSMLS